MVAENRLKLLAGRKRSKYSKIELGAAEHGEGCCDRLQLTGWLGRLGRLGSYKVRSTKYGHGGESGVRSTEKCVRFTCLLAVFSCPLPVACCLENHCALQQPTKSN